MKKRRFGGTTVDKPFYECRHRVSDLQWYIIEQIYGNDKYTVNQHLLQRELYWIDKLETLALHGMNEICNIGVFL